MSKENEFRKLIQLLWRGGGAPKENEIGGSCSADGRNKKYLQNILLGNIVERGHLGDTDRKVG
jgi:hypothetical protein